MIEARISGSKTGNGKTDCQRRNQMRSRHTFPPAGPFLCPSGASTTRPPFLTAHPNNLCQSTQMFTANTPSTRGGLVAVNLPGEAHKRRRSAARDYAGGRTSPTSVPQTLRRALAPTSPPTGAAHAGVEILLNRVDQPSTEGTVSVTAPVGVPMILIVS